MRIGVRARRWLKGLHVTFGGTLLGAVACMLVLSFVGPQHVGRDAAGVSSALVLLDVWVVRAAALGVLLSGLCESWLTDWGFFRSRWVTVKLIVTLSIVASGAIWVSQWLRQMHAVSLTRGIESLVAGDYLHYQSLYRTVALSQLAALIFLVFVSSLKPWRRGAPAKPRGSRR